MSLMGYYDESGHWQRTKFCFVHCGESCTCMPPFGWRIKTVKEEVKDESSNSFYKGYNG